MKYYYLYRYLLFLCLTLLSGYELSGQEKKIRFHYLTSENGLSHNMVDCMLQDSKGFMWFGTWNGLNRFDGYTFTVFKRDLHDTTSIGGNFIYALAEDRYGNIWVGTENGLSVYLSKFEHFIRYKATAEGKSVIGSGNVRALLIDNEGYLWAGTDRGLYRITPGDDGKVAGTVYYTAGEGYGRLSSSSVTCLLQDNEGFIWAGTTEGLNRIDIRSGSITAYRGNIPLAGSLSSDAVNAIFQDRAGVIWAGTLNGLNRFDPKTGLFSWYSHDPADSRSLVHNTVMSITEDPGGRLLVGTLGGISIRDADREGFTNLTTAGTTYFSLNNEFVNCLLCTPDGNIWAGTERGGINKFNVYQNKFEYFENEPDNPNSLSHNTVNSILEDERYIWIGTAGGGLNQYVKKSGRFIRHRFDSGEGGDLASEFISSIYRDSRDNLWIGTWGGGLHIATSAVTDRLRFRTFRNNPADRHSVVSDYIADITEDRHGNLWIATLGGIDRYDPGRGEFEHFSSTAGNIVIDRVGCILFDDRDILWAGTEAGLYRIMPGKDGLINPSGSKVDRFIADPSRMGTSIAGNYIISLCADGNGNTWFGTYGNGFSRLSRENAAEPAPSFTNFSEADGLANNIVYSIIDDNSGRIWMSTENGLSVFDPRTGRFINYFTSDGLQSNQFYWAAGYRNNKGKLYFGSMKGLNAFWPDSLSYHSAGNKTLVTSFRIFNKSVGVGEEYFNRVILNRSITETDHITLSYRVKEFSFEFTSLDYNQPERTLYAYKLEGFDDNWNYVDSKRRYVSYTNLRGGDYTFMVMSTQDGIWENSVPARITLTIIPPVWEKGWFRLLMILLTLAAVLVYIRYRTHVLLKQKEKLEKLVTERTTQIEEQKQKLELQNGQILEQRDKLINLNKRVQQVNRQQMNFFTYISHEFRSPLTLITAPLEQMLADRKINALTGDSIRMVIRNSKRLLHLVNQLMEIRKVETGRLELKASKGDINGFISEIAGSFTGLARQKEITIELKTALKHVEMWFDRDIIENIVYNLMSNALKYTPEGGLVIVHTDILQPGELPEGGITVVDRQYTKHLPITGYVSITVTDSGPGIPADKVKDIFRRFYRLPSFHNVQGSGIGLYLAREMVKAHKGLMYVNTAPGRGSSFSVLIPQNSDYLTSDEFVQEEKTGPSGPARDERQVLTDVTQVDDAISDNDLAVGKSKLPVILIVDDDTELTLYLKNNLGKNYQVLIAVNGKEGMEKACSYSPDLIISDVMMPEMDGLEFCSLIRSNIDTSHIPVILLTARTEVEHYIEGIETGADDYIAKPFNLKLLEVKIRNIITSRGRLRRLYMQNLVPVPRELTTNRTDEAFLRKAIGIVEKYFADPDFNVQRLASELGVSRSLLHKKLTAISDVSANDFITSMRLKKSALLLMEGGMNIAEIAFATGFNDPKYFSRRFKKQFGKSPTEYIK